MGQIQCQRGVSCILIYEKASPLRGTVTSILILTDRTGTLEFVCYHSAHWSWRLGPRNLELEVVRRSIYPFVLNKLLQARLHYINAIEGCRLTPPMQVLLLTIVM